MHKYLKHILLTIGVLCPVFSFFQLRMFYSENYLTQKLKETISFGYNPDIVIPLVIVGGIVFGIIMIIRYIKITSND